MVLTKHALPRTGQLVKLIRPRSGGPSVRAEYDRIPRTLRRRRWIWCCDNCGEGGMTPFIDQCSNCQHCRCDNCSLQEVEDPKLSKDAWLRNEVISLQFLFNTVYSGQEEGQYTYAPLQSDEMTKQILAIEEKTNEFTSNDDNVFQDCLQSSNLSPFSSSAPTTSCPSTPRSPPADAVFSGRDDNTESETETEVTSDEHSDITESEGETTDTENEVGHWDSMIDLLDTRLLSIIGQDHDLAAQLIPRIHAWLQLRYAPEHSYCTTTPAYGSPGTTTSGGSMAGTSSGRGGNSAGESSNQKSGKITEASDDFDDLDDDDDDDDDDNGIPEASGKKSGQSDAEGVRFACPFQKKDPARYHGANAIRHQACFYRGFSQVRRLKQHFKKAHSDPQCATCFLFFKNLDDLQQHQVAGPCPQQAQTEAGCINESQAKMIAEVLKKEKKKKKQQPSEYERWFKVFDIIFADMEKPIGLTPWHGNDPHSVPNIESFLSTFDILYDAGNIEGRALSRQHVKQMIRLTFETQNFAARFETNLTRRIPGYQSQYALTETLTADENQIAADIALPQILPEFPPIMESLPHTLANPFEFEPSFAEGQDTLMSEYYDGDISPWQMQVQPPSSNAPGNLVPSTSHHRPYESPHLSPATPDYSSFCLTEEEEYNLPFGRIATSYDAVSMNTSSPEDRQDDY